MRRLARRLKGYRTMLYIMASTAASAGAALLANKELIDLGNWGWFFVIVIMNLGAAYMRKITTSPLGKDI